MTLIEELIDEAQTALRGLELPPARDAPHLHEVLDPPKNPTFAKAKALFEAAREYADGLKLNPSDGPWKLRSAKGAPIPARAGHRDRGLSYHPGLGHHATIEAPAIQGFVIDPAGRFSRSDDARLVLAAPEMYALLKELAVDPEIPPKKRRSITSLLRRACHDPITLLV